jgi:hypothetical protein
MFSMDPNSLLITFLPGLRTELAQSAEGKTFLLQTPDPLMVIADKESAWGWSRDVATLCKPNHSWFPNVTVSRDPPTISVTWRGARTWDRTDPPVEWDNSFQNDRRIKKMDAAIRAACDGEFHGASQQYLASGG